MEATPEVQERQPGQRLKACQSRVGDVPVRPHGQSFQADNGTNVHQVRVADAVLQVPAVEDQLPQYWQGGDVRQAVIPEGKAAQVQAGQTLQGHGKYR